MTGTPQDLVNKGSITEMVAGLEMMRYQAPIQRPPHVPLGTDGEKRGRYRLPRGPRHARPAHRGEGGYTGRHEEPMDVYAREAPHRGRPLLVRKLRHPEAHRPGG